jgi:hypothetical protein
VKRAAQGVTHGCHECGQAGQWLHSCPGKVPPSEGPGSSGEGLVGTRPGRGVCCDPSGRAPQAQGRHSATAGGPGRGIGTHLGNVAIANGGDALPSRPGEFGHSPRRLRPSPPSAPLSTAGQVQHWERKRPFLEPSCPQHLDLDTAEVEIRRVFAEARQKLRAYGRCHPSPTRVTLGRCGPARCA